MNSRGILFHVLLACCLGFAPKSMAQWKKAALLPGGTIQDHFSFDSMHFLAMEGGIFQSVDEGVSWIPIPSPGNRKIYSVEALDGTILAGTPDGVFQSSMSKIGWGPFRRTGLSDSPALSIWSYLGYLYIGSVGAVYRSIDQGISWAKSESGLPRDARITRFTGIVKIAVAGSDNRGVFITESMNWIPSADSDCVENRILDLEVFGNKVYAVTSHGVLESANLGVDWDPSSLALGGITSLLGDGGYLYAGTERGIYLSIDKGKSWKPFSQGLPENSSIRSLEKIGGSIHASTDTDTWRIVSPSGDWGQM